MPPLLIAVGVVAAALVVALAVCVVRLRRRWATEEARLLAALGADEEESPIVKLVQRVVEDAYTRGADAIRIEPAREGGREVTTASVRYRVDGAWEERMTLPVKALPAVVARLRILAALPHEGDRLQEGRIALRPPHSILELDLALSTWRGADGPHAVVRLLASGSIALGLDALQLSPANLARLRGALASPRGGVVLFAGAARSGRSTTLYMARDAVQGVILHVAPDEHFAWVPGVDATNVRRLDADCIVAGELTDPAAAAVAFAAAQEGRLVLATLFADDVGTAIARLVDDLGVSRHVLGLCLRAVVAQRLVRRLCPRCKDAPAPDCPRCDGKGYKGRVALVEVAAVEGALLAALREGPLTPRALQAGAVAAGMQPIAEDARAKVDEGVTDEAAVA